MTPQHSNGKAAKEFISQIMQGVECFAKAGEIAAKAIDENPNFIDEVCDACPDVTPEVVRRFQMIGLKKLHPQLVISESPGVRRLRKLPYEIQERYVKEPVQLLINKDGRWEILKVDVRNLQPDQAAQVFTDDGLRSDAAERGYIEERAAKRIVPPKGRDPWRVVGEELICEGPCRIPRRELARCISEMK